MSTPMTKSEKKWIDGASYTQLLTRWRFAKIGEPIFTGESGEYYTEILSKKREAVGPAYHFNVSKVIGWG